MATNRFGRVRYVAADKLVCVGQLEFFLYTEPYLPVDLADARSMSDLKAALAAEVDRLEALDVDGWELASIPGSRAQVLVDTRRPDEHLTRADLP